MSARAKEQRYETKLLQVIDPSESLLLKYFAFFENNIGNAELWNNIDRVLGELTQFTRFFILSRSLDSNEFTKGIDDFTRDITQSRRYNVLVQHMYQWGDMWHSGGEEEEKGMKLFRERQDLARKEILDVCSKYKQLTDIFDRIDYETIIKFVLNCLVYATQNPADFELNATRFFTEVASGIDNDVDNIFGEDLDDTYEKDDRDVDDRILYYSDEDYEPPSKKRKEGEGMIRKNPSDMLMGKKDLLGFLKWISKLG